MFTRVFDKLNQSGFDDNDHNFMAFLEAHAAAVAGEPALAIVASNMAAAAPLPVEQKQAA